MYFYGFVVGRRFWLLSSSCIFGENEIVLYLLPLRVAEQLLSSIFITAVVCKLSNLLSTLLFDA